MEFTKEDLKPTMFNENYYLIGKYFGENLYLKSNNPQTAEIAQKHFHEMLEKAMDLKFTSSPPTNIL